MRLLATLTFLISTQVLALAPTVNITSFTYTSQERKLAELCGNVVNINKIPTYVQITVDHSTNHPATYNTFVGADGKFCIPVITYYGVAKAQAWE